MNTYYFELFRQRQALLCKEYIYHVNHYRFNWHKTIEIMLILHGEAEVCANSTKYNLKEDDILIINSNSSHASLEKKPETIALVYHIDPLFFEQEFAGNMTIQFNGVTDGRLRGCEEAARIRSYLALMMLTALQKHDYAETTNAGYSMLLLAELLRFFPYQKVPLTANKGQKTQRLIKKISRYTESHYHEEITLNDLSKLTGYNRTYLSAMFKNTVGLNYYDYLTRLRLRHTLAELNHSDRSITEIALDHGFPSAKSFAEAFKKNFQCPPKDYRSVIKIEPGLQTYHQNRQDIPVGHVLVDQKLQEYAAYNINCTNPPQTLTGNAPTEKLGEIKQALDGALEALEILMNE